jgi:septum site-determining protein MinC
MQQEKRGVIFKGNSEGLIIVIPEEYQYDQILDEVENKIQSASRFFKGARIKVTYRGAALTTEQENELYNILKDKSGATIESFSKEAENVTPEKERKHKPVPARRLIFAGTDEGNCKFVKNTVRNGTRIEYDGNVVIIGDVNPGAEVVASGNIIVLGNLRGMVHAGATGNKDAFIFALSLKPTQIRIASVIARTPEDEEGEYFCPELARIQNDTIEVVQLMK